MPDFQQHLNPEQVGAFIDGELDGEQMRAAALHLASCHPCALGVLSATQLKAATAAAGAPFVPPPDTLARLTAQLQPKTRRVNADGGLARPFWAAIAAAVLLMAVLGGWRQMSEDHAVTTELLDQHLATLSPASLPQIVSSDRHTVKPWFQGKLPFSFNLPEGPGLPPDTTLQGADLTYLEGQPAALLRFTIHRHLVSIFVTPTRQPIHLPATATESGFNVRSVGTPALRLTAVSNVNAEEMNKLLAALLRAQANP